MSYLLCAQLRTFVLTFLIPIQGTFFNDLLLSVFCELCALVQEAQVSYLCITLTHILINLYTV